MFFIKINLLISRHLKLISVNLMNNCKMKNIFLNIFVISFMFQWTVNNSTIAETKTEKMSVFELQQKGWKVVEKHSEIDERLGKKPYQELKRVVQVVTYKLLKGEDIIFCTVEYDSQLDRIIEECDFIKNK